MKKLLLLCCFALAAVSVRAQVDLSAEGSANCYMVRKAAALYSFKATVKGNGIAPYGENTAIEAKAIRGVKLLWQDADVVESSSLSVKNGRVNFRSGKALTGNAVIAIYSDKACSEGNCLWSWHIWRTDAKDAAMGNFIFLDRNLGADTTELQENGRNGCFYQWGRKDPFPQTGEITHVLAGQKVSLAFITAHPDLFISRNGSWMDCEHEAIWCKDAGKESDRGDRVSPRTKTMYDPCPPGYHVPNFCDILAIRATGSHGFLKAGARWYDLDPAYPEKAGQFGYYWSAFIDRFFSTRAADFYIWDEGSGIGLCSHYYNCSAFSVRPQKF